MTEIDMIDGLFRNNNSITSNSVSISHASDSLMQCIHNNVQTILIQQSSTARHDTIVKNHTLSNLNNNQSNINNTLTAINNEQATINRNSSNTLDNPTTHARKNRKSRLDSIAEERRNGNSILVSMSAGLTSLTDIWNEYYRGINGSIPLRQLEHNHGSKWRNNQSGSGKQ